AHEKALDPRANADSGNRLLASFRGGYQHGDLSADTRVDRIGQTDAEHDVLRTRLQVVEPSAQHVVRDFRYLRLELGIDSTNRRGAQLVSAAEHALKLHVRGDPDHVRLGPQVGRDAF